MKMKKLATLLVILMLALQGAHSQESRTEMSVDFRVNSVVIDTLQFDNADRVRHIVDYLRTISADTTIDVLEISFCGAASPEGSYQLNRRLARGRLEALERLVRSQIEIPDSIITRDDSYISWDMLRQQVAASDLTDRDEVLRIIDSEHTLIDYPGGRHIDSRIPELQKLSGGKTWQILLKKYFGRMRNAYAVFVTYKHQLPEPEPITEPEPEPIVVPEPEPEPVVVPEPEPVVVPEPEPTLVIPVLETRFIAAKTNLLVGAATVANLGFEIELGRKWSLDVPVYYSPYNITPTRKCRILATQPEVRFWPAKAGSGHFIGLHGTVGFFNIAINDHGRYQDPDSPAWGCGLGYGYALNFGANKNWGLEFNIGLGVVKYKYDVYYNRENGQKFDSGEGWWWGPTRAGITLTYKWWWPRTPKTKEVKL